MGRRPSSLENPLPYAAVLAGSLSQRTSRRPASATFASASRRAVVEEDVAADLGPGAFDLIDVGEDAVAVGDRPSVCLCLEVRDHSAPIRFKARLDAETLASPSTLMPGTRWKREFTLRDPALAEIALVLGAMGTFACHYSIEDEDGLVLYRRRVEGAGEQVVPCCFFVMR